MKSETFHAVKTNGVKIKVTKEQKSKIHDLAKKGEVRNDDIRNIIEKEKFDKYFKKEKGHDEDMKEIKKQEVCRRHY